MLKRKLGVYLITLLVITGLAGTVNDNSISKPERKIATGLMKDSYKDVLEAVFGLNEKQLNFRTRANGSSIKDYLYQIASTEKAVWHFFEKTMKTQANPEKRTVINFTDEQIMSLPENLLITSISGSWVEQLQKNKDYKSATEALQDFKNLHQDFIKYMKKTTEDLRNHVIYLPSGWMDCYQLYLLITRYSSYMAQKIIALQSDPAFPKKS